MVVAADLSPIAPARIPNGCRLVIADLCDGHLEQAMSGQAAARPLSSRQNQYAAQVPVKLIARRWRARAAVLRLGATFVLVALTALQLGSPSSVAAADGTSQVASTTYTLNPAHGRIDVVVDMKIHNSIPNETTYVSCTSWEYDYYLGYYPVYDTCPSTTRFYMNETSLWLEEGATSLKVTAASGTARISLDKRGDGFNQYKVSFSRIFRGQTAKLHVTYRLMGGAPRSDSSTRVSEAFASFCVAANGNDGGTTRVVVPSSYAMQVDTGQGSFTTKTSGGTATYQTDKLSSPLAFWGCFRGDNPSGYLTSTMVSPSGRQIEIQAWPEDTAWNDHIRAEIGDALSELEQLVGRGLPGTGPIIIQEVMSGELGAYAGTFDEVDGIARIGEDLDQPGVVAHELSHAWFNGSVFDARWMSEGSAAWAESTITGQPCRDPGAFPGAGNAALSEWEFAGPKASQQELNVVSYQYEASCYLVSTLANRVGVTNMDDVLAVLMDHKIAYQSGGLVLQGHPGTEDWRNWLDAIDEAGLVPTSSTDLDYAQGLLTKFGIADDPALLAARSAARAEYHELVRTVGDWAIPEVVLRPMGEWRFSDATAAIARAANAYAATNKADEILSGIDALNGPVKGLFESARTIADVQEAETRAREQASAAEAIAAAKARYEEPRDLVAQIGLAGTDLQPSLTAGIAAVATIDIGTARGQADVINETIANATSQGQLRIGFAVGVVLLAALAFVLLRRRRALRLSRAIVSASSVGDDAGSIRSSGVIVVPVELDVGTGADGAPTAPDTSAASNATYPVLAEGDMPPSIDSQLIKDPTTPR